MSTIALGLRGYSENSGHSTRDLLIFLFAYTEFHLYDATAEADKPLKRI